MRLLLATLLAMSCFNVAFHSASGSQTAKPAVRACALLTKEVDTYADIGLFDGVVPDISTILDDSVVKGLYDDNAKVIWPS